MRVGPTAPRRALITPCRRTSRGAWAGSPSERVGTGRNPAAAGLSWGSCDEHGNPWHDMPTPAEGSARRLSKQVKPLDRVIIRFAGDSGDGMQLTGDRFTQESAAFGNDLSTLPNFPAEIRAPQGTLPGVSSFQVHFADHDILTAGDAPDVLVAMNPAALKANLADMKP